MRFTSRMYEQMRHDQLAATLKKEGIVEYDSVCLSADQQEYEITFKDGTTKIISSGLPYHED